MIESTFLTPAALKKLEEELTQLIEEWRPFIIERIATARAHGDLKENAEYHAAKDEQGMYENRIRQIQELLKTSEVREVEITDTVEIGCIAVVDDDGYEMELFVAPAENKVDGFILASPSSPIGAALLGAKVGDTVSYEAPGGVFSLTIKAVRAFEG